MRRRPILTMAILGACVAVAAATGILAIVGERDYLTVLLQWGAMEGSLIAEGQWWRLVTAMFLHIGPLHLAFNMYALWQFGSAVEADFGRARFGAIYLFSGLCGSAASVLGHVLAGKAVVAAGASGAIFGLLGAFGTAVWLNRRNLNPRAFAYLSQSLIGMLAVNLFYGFSPGSGVDNYAHIGGLLGGAALAWPWRRDYATNQFGGGACTAAGLGVCAAILLFAVAAVRCAETGPPLRSPREADAYLRFFNEEFLPRYESHRGKMVVMLDASQFDALEKDALTFADELRGVRTNGRIATSVRDELVAMAQAIARSARDRDPKRPREILAEMSNRARQAARDLGLVERPTPATPR